MLPLAYAGTTSSGTATLENINPVITSVAFTDVAAANKNNSAIDVTAEYWASAVINDNNSLADLTTVTFKIWSVNSTDAGADAEANHYTFTYTQGTDTWAEVGPNAGGDDMIAANTTDPANQALTSGTFKLAFDLDKIADHTDSNTDWKVNVTVVDDTAAVSTNSTIMFGVAFYSEISVDDATHGWSGLVPGDTNHTLNVAPSADGNIDITVTANYVFSVQAKGNGTLASGANTMALSSITIHATTVGSAIALTTSPADIIGLTAHAAIAAHPMTFMLWITVPNPQPNGAYEYILTCSIISG